VLHLIFPGRALDEAAPTENRALLGFFRETTSILVDMAPDTAGAGYGTEDAHE
jgi:hypothetical protein